jgi:methylthioxylose transferase
MIGELKSSAVAADPRLGADKGLGRPFVVLISVWVLALIGINQWGGAINNRLPMKVFAPPIFGRFEFGPSWRVVLPVALAVLIVCFGHRAAGFLSWAALLGTAAVAALVWTTGLALVDGPSGITEPLERPVDYLANLPLATGLGNFLEGYARDLDTYSLHAQGHPPGALMFFWALDWIGLSGPGPAAAVILVAAASMVPAVLLSVGEVAGEDLARRAAPFLVLTPAAVWIATSADALFMAAGAWGIALMTLAVKRTGSKSDILALASGGVLGAGLFMSYGLVPLGLVVIALGIGLRRIRPLLMGGSALVLVAATFAASGFWWFDGLNATLERYDLGVAQRRPSVYFLVANLAALSLALGPAVLAGLARLRHRGLWLLCGGALAAVALSDISGFTKGEVERIWLPFVPWLTIAVVSLPAAGHRFLLAAQSGVALAIQIGVRTPW